MRMKISHLLMVCFLVVAANAMAQDGFECFSVMAGQNITTDGSVLLAHNEDDYGDVYFDIYLVPAKYYGKNHCKYFWLEMPGMHFSDSYMNEYGVVIASDACASREDKPSLTNGGITWELRNTMASQARTAREAVEIAARLIDEKGYNSSGRTYCIADPNEAWMLSVVYGKHYVAKRIPNDAIAIIPNYYTITDVDLNDVENVIASPDLISYAEERGWYDQAQDGDFNFRKSYGNDDNLNHPVNVMRMWCALNKLSGQTYAVEDEFPWIIHPKKRISVENLMDLLGTHQQGEAMKEKEEAEGSWHPHYEGSNSICAGHTRYGFVAQLQSGYPVDFGCVMWLAPYRPCTQTFIPLFCGMLSAPENMQSRDLKDARRLHFESLAMNDLPSSHAYLSFKAYSDMVETNYSTLIPQISKEIEAQTMENLRGYQAKLLDWTAAYKEKPKELRKQITEFSHTAFSLSLGRVRSFLSKQAPQQSESFIQSPSLQETEVK
ncbi:MAG TPA: C69 family dipeptidase [Bacteroidales bacterium]|nr:C69 family dipeptidase [Bacteroidales bacterium]HPL34457.1 C69 family dipeptidase [Bacteroidales bacterium]HQI52186.1 C69 family dipeptidase [Bacteroidales bacterium]